MKSEITHECKVAFEILADQTTFLIIWRLCFLEGGVRVFFEEKILVVSMKKFSIIYVCTAKVGPFCLCFMETSDFFNDKNCPGSFVLCPRV